MEPIEIGSRNENLYDCYTLTCVEAVFPPSGKTFEIYRKINWVTLNPHGDVPEHVGVSLGNKEEPRVKKTTSPLKEKSNAGTTNHVLPKFGSFDLTTSDVMEEDVMVNEPGLVFFEDGSYSRGLLDIPVGDVDDSNYYLSPTFKFEQCLVKGSHKRLLLWLPGGVTSYVDVSNDGILTIGVGWYSDEGINLVMERDYGINGKLKEVRGNLRSKGGTRFCCKHTLEYAIAAIADE
ncbi:hypothetical protein V6N12_057248 [Hibiscus sabdariffa]|uniref:Uncharacterized protein n=1 Tax=Hibiscus sabdariffa TaxID=183260 RepID=A0ABR2DE63_9ROSI